MNSRMKGKAGELELAKALRDHGFDCRRSVQYCGRGVEGQADLVGLPGVHVECKRVERLNIDEAMAQAVRDADEDVPAVFHRKNRKEWLVTMRMADWLVLYKGAGE